MFEDCCMDMGMGMLTAVKGKRERGERSLLLYRINACDPSSPEVLSSPPTCI